MQYVNNAKGLLQASLEGANPFEGYSPVVPAGKHLVCGTEEFSQLEARGIEIANKSAFVLVAGGLGERLGYNGIKVALPVESSTERCFLQLYCEAILSLQKASKSEHPIPLAIMTSGDTHERTEALLADNAQFGMAPGQVVLVKQELVPALVDNDAHIAVDKVLDAAPFHNPSPRTATPAGRKRC